MNRLIMRRAGWLLVFLAAILAPVIAPAMTIERVVSPKGIEAWLVRAPGSPMIALDFAMRGGANQDPADRSGVAHMVASLMDEGAGDLDSRAFQERLEERGIELEFRAGRDLFNGALRTLVENRRDAFDMLRLALTVPRFDADAIERVRAQMLARLRRETTSPNEIASRHWWAMAFAGHPYGSPVRGTLESVPSINAADLRGYVGRVLSRSGLFIGVVGDVEPSELSGILDHVFGDLPQMTGLTPVAAATPQGLGRRVVVDLDVPQAAVILGGPGIPRKDPDFMAAFIVNHILGGGSFSSRLYREVREERGLAYSVYSTLVSMDHASLFLSATATRKEKTGQTLDVLQDQINRLAAEGPSEDELNKAKSYLKGSFALRFDTSQKIANQLVGIQTEGLGIDYIGKRNSLVEAVTLADVKRVAKRLLEGGLLITVVGRPEGVTTTGGGPG